METLDDAYGNDHSGLPTLMGVPEGDLNALGDVAVAIIGAPIATPYPGFGLFSAEAPDAIRKGLAYDAPVISHHDFDFDGSISEDRFGRIVDCYDLPAHETDFTQNRTVITDAVNQILDAGACPIVIGGDDSVPTPVFQAFGNRDKQYTILQIDAHIDWRDDVMGERWGLSSTMRRASEMAHIERIVQVGMRSAGSARRGEYEDALAWGAEIITAQQLYTHHSLDLVLDHIPQGANVLITFDCDALDSSIMPAVMSPTPGGLSFWQTVGLIQGVAAKANLCGFNCVEFMPSRDTNGLAAQTAARIVLNAAAEMARVSR
ncbi:MAG: arginase family protein [Anaerolineae bacterium]